LIGYKKFFNKIKRGRDCFPPRSLSLKSSLKTFSAGAFGWGGTSVKN